MFFCQRQRHRSSAPQTAKLGFTKCRAGLKRRIQLQISKLSNLVGDCAITFPVPNNSNAQNHFDSFLLRILWTSRDNDSRRKGAQQNRRRYQKAVGKRVVTSCERVHEAARAIFHCQCKRLLLQLYAIYARRRTREHATISAVFQLTDCPQASRVILSSTTTH